MPDNVVNTKKKVKITFRTDERDILKKLTEKYKCSPFTGECYTDEVSIHKIKNLYHIILTEEQMQQFGEDYIIEEPSKHYVLKLLLMIKPTSDDNNYIFFRRK